MEVEFLYSCRGTMKNGKTGVPVPRLGTVEQTRRLKATPTSPIDYNSAPNAGAALSRARQGERSDSKVKGRKKKIPIYMCVYMYMYIGTSLAQEVRLHFFFNIQPYGAEPSPLSSLVSLLYHRKGGGHIFLFSYLFHQNILGMKTF